MWRKAAGAVADARYGDVFTIVGDVQAELAKIPSGSKVDVDERGIFRTPLETDLRRDYHEATVVTDLKGKVLHADYHLDAAKVKPQFGDKPPQKAFDFEYDAQGAISAFKILIGNMKPDLYYVVRGSHNLHTWPLFCREAANGRDGEHYVTAPASGTNGFYMVSATDDPTPEFQTMENADGTLTVTGCTAVVDGKLEVPAEIGGKKVKRIGAHAFRNRADVREVDFPAALEEIGDAAFENCLALTSVHLPDGLVRLGRVRRPPSQEAGRWVWTRTSASSGGARARQPSGPGHGRIAASLTGST